MNGSWSASSARSRNATIPTSSAPITPDAGHPVEAALGLGRRRAAQHEQAEAEAAGEQREADEVQPADDVLRRPRPGRAERLGQSAGAATRTPNVNTPWPTWLSFEIALQRTV